VSVEQIWAAEAIVPIASVQNRLNPFFREAVEGGVVDYCGENGIAFLAYSPVGGGRLNKKLPGHPTACSIADRHDISPHAVVLAWVLAQGPTVIIIPGARTVEHVLDSAAVAEIVLTPEDILEIDSAEFSTA
jgi:aryl-alcohol dehydrogenase-like predicted oxidoreductase